MLTALPDLSRRLTLNNGTAYRAFDRFDVVALPDRLLLDVAADGQPALRVSKIRGGLTPTDTRGRFDVDFVIDSDIGPIAQELVALGISGRQLSYEPDGGVLRVDGPDHQQAMLVIGPEHNPGLGASFDISPDAASLTTTWVRDGRLPFLEATLRLRVRAVASRHPAVYQFDPHAVAAALAAKFGSGADVSVATLAAVIDAVLVDTGAEVSRDPAAADAAARDTALAMRMITELTTPAATIEPLYRLRAPQDVPTGTERINLEEPAPVWLDTELRLDRPTAEATLAHADMSRVLAAVDLPTLSFGRRTIATSANLIFPVAGLLMLVADVRAKAKPPNRPQAVSASIELTAPRYTGMADLDLAPGEKLDAEVRLRALMNSADGVQELSGEWTRTTDDWVLLGTKDFPTAISVVRISPSLAELATAQVRTSAGHVVTVLDAQTLITSISMWPNTDGYTVNLHPKASGIDISLALLPGDRLELSPEMLPGFGVHSAVFSLSAPGAPVAVQWRHESAPESEARSVFLTPATPTAEINWIATSPFQPGIVWRITDGHQPWSPPVAPEDNLVVAIAS